MADYTGTNQNDLINGTNSADTINSRGGDDTINAGGGNDTINAAGGSDTIDGGSGNDTINAGGGNDTVSGGTGNDTIDGGAGEDVIDGGSGNDTIIAGGGSDTVDGGTGNDTIDGGAGDDDISGGDGNDIIDGSSGSDIIDGGDGSDVIHGDANGDNINGGSGDDQVYGDGGNDNLYYNVTQNIDVNNLTFDYYDGGAGTDNLIISATGIQALELTAALAAFNASAKNVLFNLQAYVPYMDLRVINVENITLVVNNQGPTAVADSNSVQEDVTLVATGNVLSNDTDPDAVDTKTVSLVNGLAANIGVSINGLYGTLVLNADGSYTYNLNNANAQALAAGEAHLDVFSYQMKDAAGATSTANLTITVTGTNDAPVAQADNVNISEDSASLLIDVLNNDQDVDSDGNVKTIVSINTAGTIGSVIIEGNQLRYDPGNHFDYLRGVSIIPQEIMATDTFTYTMVDAHGVQSTATVTVMINGVNDAPVVASLIPDTSTIEGTPFSFDVHANFADVDINDLLVFSATLANGDPLPAWLSINPLTGILSGTPLSGDAGVLDIKVTMTDNSMASAFDIFQLTITPNAPPVAMQDTADVANDIVGAISGNVLLNDYDPDNNSGTLAVTKILYSDVSHLLTEAFVPALGNLQVETDFGTLTMDAQGNYTYDLDNNNPIVANLIFGTEPFVTSFIYFISDGAGGIGGSNAFINIHGSVDDINVNLLETQFSLMPGIDFYTTNLLNAQSIPALLGVTISDLQFVFDPSHPEFTSSSVTWFMDPMSYDLNVATNFGAIAALTEGEMVDLYFLATYEDSSGYTDTAAITFHFTGVNSAPVVEPFMGFNGVFAVEDTPFNIARDPAVSVLDHVTDPDSPSVAVSKINGLAITNLGTSATNASNYGTIVMYDDGTWSYELNDSNPVIQSLGVNEQLFDTFQVEVTDGTATSVTNLFVEIRGSNDVADDITYGLFSPYPASYTINSVPTDSNAPNVNDYQYIIIPVFVYVPPGADPDGDPLHLEFAQLYARAINGYLETPNPIFTITGSTYADQMIVIDKNQLAIEALPQNVSYTYTLDLWVSDPYGGEFLTRVPVTITGINDAPVASGGSTSIHEAGAFWTKTSGEMAALLGASDIDHDALTVQSMTLVSGQIGVNYSLTSGVFSIDQTQFNLVGGQTESLVFDVVLNDGHGATVTSQLSLQIIDGDIDFTPVIPGIRADAVTTESFIFSPDGTTIFSASSDNVISINNLPYSVVLPDEISYSASNGEAGETGHTTTWDANNVVSDGLPGADGIPNPIGTYVISTASLQDVPSFIIGANITAGGNGGNGGTGSNGFIIGTGVDNVSGGSISAFFGDGHVAGDGGDGADGQNINYTLNATATAGSYIFGGDQANAGNGGNGGNGGQRDYSTYWDVNTQSLNQTGADGGDGGNGGDGGDSFYTINAGSGSDVIIQGHIGSGGLNGIDGVIDNLQSGHIIGFLNGESWSGYHIGLTADPGVGGIAGIGGSAEYTVNAGAGDDIIVAGKAGIINDTSSDSYINGGTGNDTIYMIDTFDEVQNLGTEMKTTYHINGGDNNDTLVINDIIDHVTSQLVFGSDDVSYPVLFEGGNGFDTIKLIGTDSFDVRNGFADLNNIEMIDLSDDTHSKANTLTMDENSVNAISATSNSLLVSADTVDSVELLRNADDPNNYFWVVAPFTTEINGQDYQLLTYGDVVFGQSGAVLQTSSFELYVLYGVSFSGDITISAGDGGAL